MGLTAIITAFQCHRFGARSEKLTDDQLELALEELDAALSQVKGGLDAARERAGMPRRAQDQLRIADGVSRAF